MRAYEFRAWIDDRKSLEFVERIDFLNKLVLFCGKSTWNDYEYEDIVLEQFTGLYDKNGVKIYEGDVVNVISCNLSGEPIYKDNVIITEITDFGLMYNLNHANEIEVIGNIHERSGENDIL